SQHGLDKIRRMYQLSTRTRTLRPSSKRYTARIRVLAATRFEAAPCYVNYFLRFLVVFLL
ncbi:hypothetical protein, partial [Thiolapillus sp.]|uniref:hypothetical protein n=1 Tax=Thiolapillus sp. TaxID=2017437 RepID=UPI003AF99A63